MTNVGWLSQRRHPWRDLGENDRASRHPNHQDSNHESKITNASGDECFVARIRRGIAKEPVANQNVGSKAHQFPKDEEHDEIVRENDPEHRKHEERKCREITRLTFVIPHVTQRIDMDGCSDTGNQDEHRLA